LKKENDELKNQFEKFDSSNQENDYIKEKFFDLQKENEILRAKLEENNQDYNVSDKNNVPLDKKLIASKMDAYVKELKKKDLLINELRNKLGITEEKKKKIFGIF
jgi:hypothetical protein